MSFSKPKIKKPPEPKNISPEEARRKAVGDMPLRENTMSGTVVANPTPEDDPLRRVVAGFLRR